MSTILYVEDHPPAQLLMQAIIDELTPHNLLLAENGKTAESLVADQKPDLYILDMDLPDTDGITLADTLCRLHPAPAILVSAYAEAVKQETLSVQIKSYLAKPLDPEHVAQTIERTLA